MSSVSDRRHEGVKRICFNQSFKWKYVLCPHTSDKYSDLGLLMRMWNTKIWHWQISKVKEQQLEKPSKDDLWVQLGGVFNDEKVCLADLLQDTPHSGNSLVGTAFPRLLWQTPAHPSRCIPSVTSAMKHSAASAKVCDLLVGSFRSHVRMASPTL